MSYKPDSISSIKLVIFPSIQVLYNDCTNLYTRVQNLVTIYTIYSITSATIKTQRKSPETRIPAQFSDLYHSLSVYTMMSIFKRSFMQLSDYLPICFATSSAKFSSFFSMPSPVSKRTNFLIVMFALLALATEATYWDTLCLPSSALT